MAPLRASNVCDDGNFSSPKECALAPVPDRMLAHAARAKGACDDFSVCRAFWSFWAPKGHDITTTKRIYDCRLRVSCIKEYKRLFNVLSVLKRYSPYSLQVSRGKGYYATKEDTMSPPLSHNSPSGIVVPLGLVFVNLPSLLCCGIPIGSNLCGA